ncbi:magnesium/cobalt transporter CorA [Tenacibaculum retecalamus]|uniref:magnesium/cobalt transporter CorA n=1 Tax=Tenacibaculum retecalamus TaxID=3018315 RepID=UPI0023D931FC|nr:magnesium/cobalt transporter CorA [Tenacibaculum retecalamus]WBX71291.1 magnesium/cobalt transporter CorA [Tenacibaculum retecalamus]
MKKSKFKKKIGLPPGTITYTGDKESTQLFINAFDYTKDSLEEKKINKIESCFGYKETETTTWININGLNNVDAIQKIGNHYKLHPLILEDTVNINQRPKIDEYDDYIFVVFKMLYYDANQHLKVEHISIILGDKYVLSFQESEEDVFDGIRERIRTSKGIIRSNGSDYLLYALMDAVVDNYFLIIETMGEKVEKLEELLFTNPNNDTVKEIQALKREALKIRRSIFPLREIVSKLEKAESKLVKSKTLNYFRDLYDHTIQVIETIEIYRDMLWGLMDMYMTSVSNRMNEVMKVLTVISTIFIPLTFIAGIYGMNFDNIPELHYANGYYILWGFMIFLFFGLLYFFKRKKWF